MDEKEGKETAKKCKICCGFDCDSGNARWTFIRFTILCLLSVLILITVHAVRTQGGSKHDGNVDGLYGVGDAIYPRDLWLIIELPSDSLGLRTELGKKSSAHVCSAIRAGQSVGWTPLVLGGKSKCCRSRCHHLHPTDIPKMNHSISKYLLEVKGDVDSALRTAGFLQAIEKGAHFIFTASPDVYYVEGIDPNVYQSELKRQLRKMTLGISIGLVKEGKFQKSHITNSSSFYDPYGHFGPSTINIANSSSLNQYKICELRPPSVEKFLESDTRATVWDTSAPPLTIPGEMSCPFDSRNTLFNRDSFLTLLLLPEVNSAQLSSQSERGFLRSIIGQAILKQVAGSTKFSISSVPLSSNLVEKNSLSTELKQIQTYLSDWTCTKGTAFQCYEQLLNELVYNLGILNENHVQIAEKWLTDLNGVGYKDFKTISYDPHSPCIGSDALMNVYFHSSMDLFQSTSIHKNNNSLTSLLNRLCPSVEIHSLNFNRLENILLIVHFESSIYYDSINLFEIVYRRHFKNILYCGPPTKEVENIAKKLNDFSGKHFSFLPLSSKKAYECVLGAIEMGYNVDGFILANTRTLINSWNFEQMNPKVIWHGNEHARHITPNNINNITDEGQRARIMNSIHGLVETFNFLKQVLDEPHYDNQHLDEDVVEGIERNVTDLLDIEIEDQNINTAQNQTEEETLSGLHLNIFGEINEEATSSDYNHPTTTSNNLNKNITELLFHPANLISHFENGQYNFDDNNDDDQTTTVLSSALEQLQTTYESIVDKLEEWGESYRSHCHNSINPEICNLVSNFFDVLKSNDGEKFTLIYDDLPLYYVPIQDMYKDELYLMANLFTKYQVDNEIAFPLLLRGLSLTSTWSPLSRSSVVHDDESYKIDSIDDLLLFKENDDEVHEQELLISNLENAHYVYPINMSSVLSNDVIKSIFCKNL